eukprot:jgi/Botrbrau1/11650/Bobra.168_2s0007.1
MRILASTQEVRRMTIRSWKLRVLQLYLPPLLSMPQLLIRLTGDSANVVGAASMSPAATRPSFRWSSSRRGCAADPAPHFFRGVATIVAKLFNIVEPDIAAFGLKDYQQWRVISRMARDLDFPVRILGCPIAREPDGLAMSSRNALLTKEDRAKAVCISRALQWAAEEVAGRGTVLASELIDEVSRRIADGGGAVDYVEVVDAEELTPLVKVGGARPALIAVAAKFGKVRLIDNRVLGNLPT